MTEEIFCEDVEGEAPPPPPPPTEWNFIYNDITSGFKSTANSSETMDYFEEIMDSNILIQATVMGFYEVTFTSYSIAGGDPMVNMNEQGLLSVIKGTSGGAMITVTATDGTTTKTRDVVLVWSPFDLEYEQLENVLQMEASDENNRDSFEVSDASMVAKIKPIDNLSDATFTIEKINGSDNAMITIDSSTGVISAENVSSLEQYKVTAVRSGIQAEREVVFAAIT